MSARSAAFRHGAGCVVFAFVVAVLILYAGGVAFADPAAGVEDPVSTGVRLGIPTLGISGITLLVTRLVDRGIRAAEVIAASGLHLKITHVVTYAEAQAELDREAIRRFLDRPSKDTA